MSETKELVILPLVSDLGEKKRTQFLLRCQKYYMVATFGCKNLEISKRFAQVQLGLMGSVVHAKIFIRRQNPQT